MRHFNTATAASLIVLSACALPAPAIAVKDDLVTETLRLTHAVPSEVIKTLRQDILDPGTAQPKSAIPAGIVRISQDNAGKSITVRGSAKAIADLTAMIRLLDVKPRYLEVKMRLIEIRLTPDGTRKETLLQAPSLVTRNNVSARVSLVSSLQRSMSFSVAPHLNGDGTISLSSTLGVRHATSSGPPPQRTHTSAFTSTMRLTRRDDWQSLREVSVKDDERLQKAVFSETNPPTEIYPLYRWEISASPREDVPRP
ncbi:MAG: hypothetical protein V4671_33125 [Armatimonadota bacterium]